MSELNESLRKYPWSTYLSAIERTIGELYNWVPLCHDLEALYYLSLRTLHFFPMLDAENSIVTSIVTVEVSDWAMGL